MRLWDRLGAQPPPNRASERALNRGVWPAGAALIWVVLSLLGMLVLFYPAFTAWILRTWGGTDPRGLLTGHLRCCQAIALGMGAVLVVHSGLILLQLAWVGRHILAVRRERRALERTELRTREVQQQLNMEAVHAMAGAILLCGMAMSICFTACFGYISAREGIWTFPAQVRADLRQLEEGALEELEVWVSPEEGRSASLPGPCSSIKSGDRPVTLRFVIGADTGYEWLRLCVPKSLRFSPNPERPFEATQTAAWNQTHAQRYLVQCTTNLRLAVNVVPIE